MFDRPVDDPDPDGEFEEEPVKKEEEEDPDFQPSQKTRSRSRGKLSVPTTARTSRARANSGSKPAKEPASKPRARQASFSASASGSEQYDDRQLSGSEDDLDAPLRSVNELISSSHAHRGAPPHASNQPIGETEDLIAKLEEDDRVLEQGGKGLSSRERRQLRNKISARNFRARRKEVGLSPSLYFVGR
jgi:hypothetical protein